MNGSAKPTRKVALGASAGALAGIIGYIIRTKVRGWEDFPTEMLSIGIGGVVSYFVSDPDGLPVDE